MSTIVDNMSTVSLSDALFTRTQKGVFRELFSKPEGSHLRELERTTGVNGRHLLRELHTLRDAGILVSKKVGNAVVYRFNPDCPIHEYLLAIIQRTVGLIDVVKEAIEPYEDDIAFAYIFGSHATNEQRSDSDVDLMIVGSLTRRRFSSALRSLEELLKRDVNAVFYEFEEYYDQLADEDSFVARVHDGPRIDLDVF